MNALPVSIRQEVPEDHGSIRAIHDASFPSVLEGELVDRLRGAGRLTISLLALWNGDPVGHVAFSPVTIDGVPVGLGLAPVAVHPMARRRGVAGQLIRHGLMLAASASGGPVVVLGDPAYYSRFGFQPARLWNLSDEYGGGDAFQAIVSRPDLLPAQGGLVRYAPEFADLADSP